MATPRRPSNPKDAAELLFKPAKKVAASVVERPAIPNAKELVSFKIDSDILTHFQADGPGWQERINDTLRAAMNLSRYALERTRTCRVKAIDE